MAPTGFLALVLHTHLPYVRHPEYDEFLEESWLYEAITETYIPLLDMLERLARDRVPCRLTMSLTPPLLNMLSDPLLQDRYLHRLDRLIELAVNEQERTRSDPALHLLQVNEKAARAQIRIGVEEYRRFFGRSPLGFWLPECAYYPGVDVLLKDYGIQYFVVDTHAIVYATPRPFYAVYAPLYCPSGVAAFGRDVESSKQVWSAVEGYPGDEAYRDFYRDVGYDLDYDYIRPYLPPTGERVHVGIKYYRITGRTEEQKAPYDPRQARERAAVHASNFMFNRGKQIEWLAGRMDR